MKFIKICSIFVILLPFSFCLNLEGKVLDRVVAVVNNDVITEGELEEALIPLRAQYSQTVKSKRELRKKLKEAREQTLEQLIEKSLLLQKVKEEEIKVYDSEIERMVADIKESFSSPDKFQEWLVSQHLSEAQLTEHLTEQTLIRKFINKKLRADITVSPEEIRAYYEKNKDKFTEGPQVSLSYILIEGPPKREISQAEILVSQVWEKLKEGVDFNVLVKEYSDGPKYLNGSEQRFINTQTLAPELREIVKKLKVGEVSEIIRSPSGFNIIKLTGRKEKKVRELSDAENLIEEQIVRDKLEKKYQTWIKELKEEAYIERKELN